MNKGSKERGILYQTNGEIDRWMNTIGTFKKNELLQQCNDDENETSLI